MNKFLFLLSFLLSFTITGQTDTLRIVKFEKSIYKCESKSALSWYICLNGHESYLADLKINPNDIPEWFDRFSNSQNIFKTGRIGDGVQNIVFVKPNDPESRILFEIDYFDKNKIVLSTKTDTFIFEKFEL